MQDEHSLCELVRMSSENDFQERVILGTTRAKLFPRTTRCESRLWETDKLERHTNHPIKLFLPPLGFP